MAHSKLSEAIKRSIYTCKSIEVGAFRSNRCGHSLVFQELFAKSPESPDAARIQCENRAVSRGQHTLVAYQRQSKEGSILILLGT